MAFVIVLLLIVCGLWLCDLAYYRSAFSISYHLKKQNREAAEQEVRAILSHPRAGNRSLALAYRVKAFLFLRGGRIKEARDQVSLALELRPSDARSHLLSAMTDWYSHPDQALRALDKAQTGCPFFEVNLRRTIQFFRGLSHISLGQGEEALQLLTALPPKFHTRLQRYLGQAYSLTGQYSKALEHFQAAGEQHPRTKMGWFLLQKKRAQEALFWASRAEVDEHYLNAMHLQSTCLFVLDRPNDALEIYRKVVQVMSRPRDFVVVPELTRFGQENGQALAPRLAFN